MVPSDGKIKPEKLKEFKTAFTNALNVLALKLNCYLGLGGEQALGEDWAIRIYLNAIKLVITDTTSSLSKDIQELKLAQLHELLACLCPEIKQKENPMSQDKVLALID